MKTQRIAVLLLATIVITAGTVKAEDPVAFADPALKTVVEEQLGVANPTPTALLKLNALSASSRKIANLTGLEYAKNLSDLRLEGNQIADLSPLVGLINLRLLELNSNQIKDITPLSSLIGLRRLGLWENKIESLKALSTLVLLESLEVRYNKVTTLEGIAPLANLNWAGLGNNPLVDISALAGLTNLESLDLARSNISDITPLAGLTRLTHLDLSNNLLTDIRSLAGLTNLVELRLHNYRSYAEGEANRNQIPDLAPLASLVKLERLDLEGNLATGTSALSGLTRLTWLSLAFNRVNDLSGLAGLQAVTDLDLMDNQIRDLTPLKNLAVLERLVVDGNPVADIAPLGGLARLKELKIARTLVTNIEAAASLHNLEWLDAAYTPVADLGPLSKLTSNLRALGFYGSRSIYDISPLAGLTNLDSLDLTSNYVINISALASLGNLQGLNLGDNRISDISPLTGLTSLRSLWLTSNPLNAKACSVHIPMIKLNNPGLQIYYDACTGRVYTLTVSAAPGGSVAKPGQGAFICTEGEWVQLEAVAKEDYVFTRWSGTAVDAGMVAKPTAPSTTVTVKADCTVIANFKSTSPTSPPAPTVPSAIVEDFEKGTFGAGWSSAWYITSDDRHSGQYSVWPGPMDDNQISPLTLQATVAAGRIRFWRKVSSEGDCDIYRFYIDGNERETLSGEQDWREVSFPITAGKHTFTWEYRKDPSGASGADTVYIDDVSLPVAP